MAKITSLPLYLDGKIWSLSILGSFTPKALLPTEHMTTFFDWLYSLPWFPKEAIHILGISNFLESP
jgi:hypothetical protein